jgi:DNA-binding NarL/FixJ family response regulator
MDVIQVGMTGIESARSIREQNRNIKIVLVSEYFNKEFLMAARKMDLNGYLVRTNDSSLLRQVVKDVEVGKFYLFMS